MKPIKTESIPEINELLSKLPPENLRFITLSMTIAQRVNDILEERGIEKQDFATAMGWTPSGVSKLISGSENLTLRTIAKVEAVLGVSIITFA